MAFERSALERLRTLQVSNCLKGPDGSGLLSVWDSLRFGISGSNFQLSARLCHLSSLSASSGEQFCRTRVWERNSPNICESERERERFMISGVMIWPKYAEKDSRPETGIFFIFFVSLSLGRLSSAANSSCPPDNDKGRAESAAFRYLAPA